MVRADVVEEVLRESVALHGGDDPELAALAVAILIEDALDIVLTDDEIDLEVLGSPDRLRGLVRDRLLES